MTPLIGVVRTSPNTTPSFRRVGVVLAIAVALIDSAVFFTANMQRSAALLGARQQEASLRMASAMFDQEAGARGFFQTRERKFLRPWDQGTTMFAASLAELRSLVAGDSTLRPALADLARRASAWHASTAAAIRTLEQTGRPQPHADIERSRQEMEEFRTAHDAFDVSLSKANVDRLTGATVVAIAVTAALAAILIGIGLLMVRKMASREAARHRDQAQLRELLQASDSEDESRTLLIRTLEMLAPGAHAAVLSPEQGNDRLTITSGDPSDPVAARASNEPLRPRACMAMRLGRAFDHRPRDESLLRCEICGATQPTSVCEPLLVGGQTIGSVLLTSEKALKAELLDRIRETVAQAAPILANQRNLMLAESLARSDPLTGLSNRRAADEMLERMIARAERGSSSASIVLLDLDGLKQLNDRHGHESGDRALASLGQIISSTIRSSDFAARTGGDEFMIILPGTGYDDAINVAEKLRSEIERTEVGGLGRISASLGVAVLPTDAANAEDLLRKADRALYAAKKQGRNCVGAYGPLPAVQTITDA
jgi:diguanylate cyclase (GGDEF)-like protein